MDAEDRRDSGAGQRADLQSERVLERVAEAAPQPRRAGHLRARIDVQGRDRERGARRARDRRRRPHRRLGRKNPIRIARHRRHARLRVAVVHRRDREIEQRRRHQGRPDARAGAAGAVCAPLWIRSRALARFSGRDDGHRVGSAQARQQRARVDVDGLPGGRDAAADGGGGQLGRQRRRSDSAARRPRAHSRRQACRGEADRPRPDDLERHRRRRSPESWSRSSSAARRRTRRSTGYTIAGKTGTAAKLVNGRYSNTDYYASFVGFLPSRNPVATIIVVIDSPHAHGYYGGPIAGPVFQRIAEATLRHLGVPPTLNAPPPVLVARRSRTARDSAGAQPAAMPRSSRWARTATCAICRIFAGSARAKRCVS